MLHGITHDFLMHSFSKQSSQIYLDNNATTLVDPRVVQAMVPFLSECYGNPSSMHWSGRQAQHHLMQARESIAAFFQVKPREILFTSSGTEGANMLIRGLFPTFSGHIVTSSVEHACVYATVKKLEEKGCSATFISPGLHGAVTVDAVKAAVRPDTRCIVLMAVNNETGVKTDLAAIAEFAEAAHIPLLIDGVCWLGKERVFLPKGVSAAWFSGHKLHAPKGIGFAVVRRSVKIAPLLTGGEQEYGLRGGTENLPGIVALAEAVRLLSDELPTASLRMERLRNKLEQTLRSELPGTVINGEGQRVCNTTNLAFEGIDGETLIMLLDRQGLAVSHGSACSSGALEPSRALLNMGIPLERARSSIRFSLSRFTKEEEIDEAIRIILHIIHSIK